MTILLQIKAADTARTSTTTLADDPDLALALEAGKKYLLDLSVEIDAGATPDIKIALKFTGTLNPCVVFGAVCNQTGVGNNWGPGGYYAWCSSASIVAGTVWGSFSGLDTANSRAILRIQGLIDVATAGTFSLQWAQNVSSATGTTFKKGSYLRMESVDAGRGSALVKQSNESRTTAAAVADDGELVGVSLEADKIYVVSMVVFGHTKYDYNHNLNIAWNYSGTVAMETHLFRESMWTALELAWTTGGAGAYEFIDAFDFSITIDSNGSNSSAVRGFCAYHGLLHTDTGGDMKLQWGKSYNGSGSAVYPITVYAGSYISFIDVTDSFPAAWPVP